MQDVPLKSDTDPYLRKTQSEGVWFEDDIALFPQSPPPVLFSKNGHRKRQLAERTRSYACLGKNQASAIQRLSSSAWLNDLEIFDYIESVASKQKGRSICVLPSQYFPKGKVWDTFFERISNPNNKLAERRQERNRLLDAELILCPISIDNLHWYLMVISKSPASNKIIIRCLDGLNDIEAHAVFYESGKRLIQGLYSSHKEFEFDNKSVQIRKQMDSKECGTVICYYADEFCKVPNLFEKSDDTEKTEKIERAGMDNGKIEESYDYSFFRQTMIEELNNTAAGKKPALSSAPSLSQSHMQLTPTRLKAF